MKKEDLSPELKEKTKSCKTTEELMELAREEGVELSDEQLEGIAGGWGTSCDNYDDPCPGDNPGT